MNWNVDFLGRLQGRDAPRVVTFQDLIDVARSVRPGVHEITVRSAIDQAVANRLLAKVNRGLYINKLATPAVSLAEASPHIRKGAVVSLQSVLGEFGVANNPASAVTCVLPYGSNSGQPSTGQVQTELGLFIFHALPERLFPPAAGAPTELLLDRPYPIFRAEKAFLDWLYLGATAKSTLKAPPVDFDLEQMDLDLVGEIAKQSGLTALVETYLDRHHALAGGEEGAQLPSAPRRSRP